MLGPGRLQLNNYIGLRNKLPSLSKATFHSSGVLPQRSSDVPTHTGQVWDKDDSRMARFEVNPKKVNPNWSISLIKETPPIPVKGRIAVCEGGPSEALGHPKIFINLDVPEPKACIYCGLRYFKEGGHH